jgi:hypothetical protein
LDYKCNYGKNSNDKEKQVKIIKKELNLEKLNPMFPIIN